MNIYIELDNLVSEFMVLPSVDEKNLVDFEDKFSGLVFDYAKMVQEDDEELEKIFYKYFDVLYREEILSLFENFSIEVDTKINLELLGNLNLAKNYCFAKIEADRDRIARSIRFAAEYFYYDMPEDAAEAAADVEQKLGDMMSDYISEQFSTKEILLAYCKSANLIGAKILKWELEEYLSNNFTAAYNQYNFILRQFVEDYLPDNYPTSSKSTTFISIEDYVSEKDIITLTGDSALDTMDNMYKIADSFNEHRSCHSEGYTVEAFKQMCNLVTDFLYYKSEDFPNMAATVFDSFLYLCQTYGLFEAYQNYTGDFPTLDQVLYYCENKSLIDYLGFLADKDYDSAIAYNSEYEIAHYHKLLGYFSSLNTVADIARLNEANREAIYFHWQHIGHTYDLYTDFFNTSNYIESLDSYPSSNVDITDALAILKHEQELAKKRDVFLVMKHEAEMAKKNAELEELNEKNRLMVKRYSHSWANLLYPDAVFSVAKTLSSNPQYKKEALDLMRAYNNETLLRQQSYMLELRHSNDTLAVQQHIRKGISNKASDSSKSVMNLIHYSLERVLFRILMENGERSRFIRSILSRQGYSDDLIREDFAEKLIYEQEDITSWFNNNLFQFNVSIDDNWNKLYVSADSGAAAFIVEIFTELFLNALTYGSKTKDSKINLQLTTEDGSNSSFLKITCSNSLDKLYSFTGGTNDGLKSLNELLKMVNFNDRGKNHRSSYLEYSEDSDFDLSLYIAKNLLVKKEVVL